MATSSDVASFYANVVRTVIQDLREEMINMGVDEQVLFDLQTIWEQKLLASRVFNANDYPLAQREVGGTTGGFVYREGFDYGSRPGAMPMNPYPQMNQGYGTAPVRLNPIGRPYYNPQAPNMAPPQDRSGAQGQGNPPPSGNNIPQYDGAEDDIEAEDTTQNPTEEPEVKEQAAAEEELGSDLDDDSDDADEDKEVDNLLLCLYEKVNRTRNKWKTNFKSGIFSIDGKDYAFSRLLGDFEW